MSTYIIAEAGVNHNGRLDWALRLCDAAREAGADAVKFQTWRTERLATRTAAKAPYQAANATAREGQYEMLRRLELSYDDFRTIQLHCRTIGIDFLSTPDEEESLAFLSDELQLPRLKIGSGEVTNLPYLRAVGRCRRPVILSTGLSTLEQVQRAYDTLLAAGAPQIDLLHCTTNYPCPYDEVNLRAMVTLRETFGCRVGYSDHTLGIEVPIAATALGAELLEKHFTLDKALKGPDHRASLNPVELQAMVRAVRHTEQALGDGVKRPNASELIIARSVQKRIVARHPIRRGEPLTEQNLTAKRTDRGISVARWDEFLGKSARRDYAVDEPIEEVGR